MTNLIIQDIYCSLYGKEEGRYGHKETKGQSAAKHYAFAPLNQTGQVKSSLLAYKSSCCKQKKNFIYENRNIAAENGINNTASNYGRHTTKNQNPQFPADVHLVNPPITCCIYIINCSPQAIRL